MDHLHIIVSYLSIIIFQLVIVDLDYVLTQSLWRISFYSFFFIYHLNFFPDLVFWGYYQCIKFSRKSLKLCITLEILQLFIYWLLRYLFSERTVTFYNPPTNTPLQPLFYVSGTFTYFNFQPLKTPATLFNFSKQNKEMNFFFIFSSQNRHPSQLYGALLNFT